MQRLRLSKAPRALRLRAEELKRKAERLIKEADDLIARAEECERSGL
jgi:hypothetical protein